MERIIEKDTLGNIIVEYFGEDEESTPHGELKAYKDSKLFINKYYDHGDEIIDLIMQTITDEDKLMLKIKHGGNWL